MLDFKNRGLKRRLQKTEYTFDKDAGDKFTNNVDHNAFFIKHTEVYYNALLFDRGYVFLNEVLKALGLTPTIVGNLAGWTQGPIDIDIQDSKYQGFDLVSMGLSIQHEGIILFDALGD